MSSTSRSASGADGVPRLIGVRAAAGGCDVRLFHAGCTFTGLVAPFEVGFLAYTNFFQRVDAFAAMLFYFGLFVFFSLAFKIFKRSIAFAAGWWALSFPIAALCNAALRYAEHVRHPAMTGLAVALLAFLSGLIAVLLFRTIRLAASGKLLAPR